MESINHLFYSKIVTISQSETAIQNDRDTQNFKSWRTISLLNTDTKIKQSQSYFKQIKSCFTKVNFLTTNVYVKNRLTRKSDMIVS